MNNYTLDQKRFTGRGNAAGTTANVQRKSHTTIPRGSILEKLVEFAYSVESNSKCKVKQRLRKIA